MEDLAGRVAVVTGGGSGIGEGMVKAFAEHGMVIAVADIEAEQAERVAVQAERSGAKRAVPVQVDVTKLESVRAVAARVHEELGEVQLLANNAGVLLFGNVSDATVEDWRWVFEVNVFGIVNCLEAFLPAMRARGGPAHIVNTGSPAGFGGSAFTAVYSASKNAVVALSEALREELAPQGIGVSVLCPSNVNTRILDAQRNRHAGFGPRAPDLLGTGPNHPEGGMELVELGRLVCAAVRANELYIFNTPHLLRPRMTARFEEIISSLQRYEERVRDETRPTGRG